MMVPEKEFNGMWKFLIVSSFAMLSALTWGASPIQKLIEKVQKKETVKAQVKICRHIESMQDVYEQHVKNMFASGCMWTTREVMIGLHVDKKDYYKKLFEDKDDLEYEKFKDNCLDGGSEYQRQGKIKEVMVSDLYHDQMKCPDVYKEAEKLGLKEDDYVQ